MPKNLKEGWTQVTFGEMVEHIAERVQPTPDDGENYIGLEHLESGSLTVRRWGAEVALIGIKLRMRKGDILFARRNAYLRRVAIAPHDGLFSAHGMIVRARPSVVLPEFLPFFMQSDLFMDRAEQISVGSLSPTINWKTLAQEKFALPPLDEQRRIAEALWCLLDSTEAFQRAEMHAVSTREAYARTLWGVQALPFKRLSGVCLKIQDGTHFSPKSSAGEYRYVTSKNIRDGYLDLSDAGWISKQEHDGIFKRCDVRYGDVLFTKDGANAGNVAVNDVQEPFSLLSSVAIIRPNPEVLLGRYVFQYMRSRLGRGRILSHVKGSAITRLVLAQIRALEVPVPPLEVQQRCSDIFATLDRALGYTKHRITAVSEIRRHILNGLEVA